MTADPRHVPPYLRGLNPAQREAALTINGPLLVLAGAGSGKTRTLVHRIVHLLESGVHPKHVLAVTFTNRAAAEMRERVARSVGKAARQLTISTFHSLGARILRDHGASIDLPSRFAIYSSGDQMSLVRRILSEEVHVVATAGNDVYDAKRVLSTISGWKNRMLTPDEARQEVIEGRMKENRDDDYAVLAADAYPRYEESLRAAGACDFDDLLLLPVKLLGDDADAREAVWRRWHYLMVDEYQDTNAAQLEMARLIAGPRKNLCVVGDDDQSIYAWRGADLRNILQFERHFSGARVIILEENYRSTKRILQAANAVIANNSARTPKQMRTDNGLGPKIDYWEVDAEPGRSAEENEAAMVAREIGVRRFHEKLNWSDFAILYRANHQSRVIEEALRNANIPYRVVGGVSYYDRKEIADAAAYLKAVLNPRDDLSLRRIINFPTRGIGRTTLFRLVEAAGHRRMALGEILTHADEIEDLSPAQANAVLDFGRMMERYRAELREVEAKVRQGATTAGTLAGWVESFLRGVGLPDGLRSEASSEKLAQIRVENLLDFVGSLQRYEERTWSETPMPDEEIDWAPPSLADFLRGVSLYADSDEEKQDDEAELVTLLTLHSAKGLEFAHVFVVGLEEEILPHARSVESVNDEGVLDPIAEERRLFYVGITRARHRLTLSGCRTRMRGSETLPRQPSRFLGEIPGELLDRKGSTDESSLAEEDREEMRQNFFEQMREMLN